MPTNPAPQPACRPRDPAARAILPLSPPKSTAVSQIAARIDRVPLDPQRRHAELLEPVLPLLSQQWQRARLSIGEFGEFAHPPGCRPEDRLELDLRRSDTASMALLGDARIALSYNGATIDAARAALHAIASWAGAGKRTSTGGWPIARDERSLALLTLAERIAGSEIPVLLEGPTGTGKEVLARFVHNCSRRAAGPFVAINCAAMPEAMLEGMLFGHRKGAFTGASEAREGLFRAADGGTLLLDEIGELPLALQAKLLRALQEGEVLPLGETSPVHVDVRVIAATNRHLASEVEAGRFREDLLYRLNVFPLELAALRNRPGDIAPLAFGMLLRHACRPAQTKTQTHAPGHARARPGPAWISDRAIGLLEMHPWPGNVRELENVIRRAILLAGDAPCITASHIVFDQPVRPVGGMAPGQRRSASMASLSDIAFQSEAEAILAALGAHDGHRARTARALGISERTLRYRLASMRESGMFATGGEA